MVKIVSGKLSSLIYMSIFLVAMFFPLTSFPEESWGSEEILLQLQKMSKVIEENRKEIVSLEKRLDAVDAGRAGVAVVVPLNQMTALGEGDAQIGVVEFSDFQCPYCARHAASTLPELMARYVNVGKVKYYSRQFPLSFHGMARNASIAALCAGRQGNFWGMHDYLFKNSRKLNPSLIAEGAAVLALDRKAFDDCVKDSKMETLVDQDIALGERMGVSGTPKFFVGRIEGNNLVDAVPLSGAQPYSTFQKIIDKFLVAQ